MPRSRDCCRTWTIRWPVRGCARSTRSDVFGRPKRGIASLLVLHDPEAYIRSLGRADADAELRRRRPSSRRSSVASLLLRAADDPSPQVRINALRSLGSYKDSTLASKIVPMLDDPLSGIQLQAAEALGELGGADAAKGLARVASGKGAAALRRAALVGARPGRFRGLRAGGGPLADEHRLAGPRRGRAGNGDRRARPVARVPRRSRRPGRCRRAPGVVGRGSRDRMRRSWPPRDRSSRTADAAVRSVAADAVARAADPADLPALARMYQATGHDSFPEAALSALDAILAIRQSGDGGPGSGGPRNFSRASARPGDYLHPALGRGEVARGRRTLGAARIRSRPAARCRTTAISRAAISRRPTRSRGPTS